MAPVEESSHAIENMQDPPLTNLGVQQSEHTAKVLAFMLKENDIEEVIVESSPFLRTMMTASIFLKHLKSEIPTAFMEKNQRLREILLPKYFDEDPSPNLICNKYEKVQFCQKYL